jgi:protein phosphatase 1 regulatory subunit 42
MEINKNIVDLIFPSFENPKESRFKNFFKQYNNKQFEDKIVKLNGYKIYTGEDKRTTIIIKNIPKNMTKNQFKMVLENIANINYIYIPLFMLTRDNLRCAYVNVVNPKSIIDIYLKLRKINFKYDNPNTKIEIIYSNFQGRKALIDNFKEERNIFRKKVNTMF